MTSHKLKFIFISADRYPPFRADLDTLFGVEFSKRGHQIDLILQSDNPVAKSYRTQWRNFTVWVARNKAGTTVLSRIKRHIDKTTNSFKIFRLTKENSYDFIQVKDMCLPAVLALIAAKTHNIPFVYWLSYPFPEASLHGVSTGIARYPLLYYIRGKLFSFLLYKVIMRFSDHNIVQSEQMKKDLISYGVPQSSMTPMPMGVATDMFQKTRGMLEIAPTTDRIVYLGTLARVRKIDFLIRVLALVKQQKPQATLLLVGAGSDPKDEELLIDQARKLNILDSLVFTGFLPMEQAWEKVASASICVSPFFPTPILNSTSPTKLIEYMALGKPVVANDHPEQRLVIDESGAGFCVEYDEAAFAEAIIKLLNDPSLCAAMGKRGRLYAQQNRAYSVIADSLESTYQRICSGRSYVMRPS